MYVTVATFVVFWITTGSMEKKSQEGSTFDRKTQKARQEFTKMHVNQHQSFWENILLNWRYKTEPFWSVTAVVLFYVWKGTNKFILVCNCFKTQGTLYSSSTTILYMVFADHRKCIQIWLEQSFVLFIASPSFSKEIVHSRNLVLCLHETIWTVCLKKKTATLSYSELNPIFGPLYSRKHFCSLCLLVRSDIWWVAWTFFGRYFVYVFLRLPNILSLSSSFIGQSTWCHLLLKLDNYLPREGKNRLWELH